MNETYRALNDMLVHLFSKIMDLEEKALITEEFSDITNNDMHIIEAIGIEEPRNMSTIAKQMAITTGALTIAMNALVRKGYAERSRSDEDRRIVYISLTESGIRAYRHHQAFHEKMIQRIMENLSPKEEEVLVKTLDLLKDFFESYK